MTDLTESEILDCLKTNLHAAIFHCAALAKLPMRGPTYSALRQELKLAEGCCRQIAAWREDARWLRYGLLMEEAHQRSGNWLRSHAPRPLFVKLSEALAHLLKRCGELETKATGRVGMILPKPLEAPHRDTRPVQVKTPGLIVPVGYSGEA